MPISLSNLGSKARCLGTSKTESELRSNSLSVFDYVIGAHYKKEKTVRSTVFPFWCLICIKHYNDCYSSNSKFIHN